MEIRRGVVRGFDSGTYRATLQIDGSIATYLEGVPVARNIAAAEMVNGRRAAVVFLEPSNPEAAVVVAVW